MIDFAFATSPQRSAEELFDLFIFNEKLNYVLKNYSPKALKFATAYLEELSSLRDQIWKTSFYSQGRIEQLHTNIEQQVRQTLGELKKCHYTFKEDFLSRIFKKMLIYFVSEEQFLVTKKSRGEYLDFSLDRSFDWIDEILGMNFTDSEETKPLDYPRERLYLNSGKGVQTNFGSIALILSLLDLQTSKVIFDLGSGFGRIGFFVGLLNQIHRFEGFEIVPDRVEKSNQIAKNFNLTPRVQFHCKDLTRDPIDYERADIFYLYDPFQDETYQRITERVRRVSRSKNIQVITKGNSKSFIAPMAQAEAWPKPIVLQDGNINIFKNYQTQ